MSTFPDETQFSTKSQAIKTALSEERLARYLVPTGGDLEKALQLYTWNTQMSCALYGSLQGVEVILRNAINRELTVRYGEDWHLNKPIVFSDQQMERINKVKGRWDKPRAITLPDIVANLSFGFWSEILDHRMYETLWNSVIHKAFPHRPKGTRRPQAAAPVLRLHQLRNRIAHHEPIWQRKLDVDEKSINQIAHWICPQTAEWITEQSTVAETIKLKPDWLQQKHYGLK